MSPRNTFQPPILARQRTASPVDRKAILSPNALRTVLIAVRNPDNGDLLAVRLNHGRGWYSNLSPADT